MLPFKAEKVLYPLICEKFLHMNYLRLKSWKFPVVKFSCSAILWNGNVLFEFEFRREGSSI